MDCGALLLKSALCGRPSRIRRLLDGFSRVVLSLRFTNASNLPPWDSRGLYGLGIAGLWWHACGHSARGASTRRPHEAPWRANQYFAFLATSSSNLSTWALPRSRNGYPRNSTPAPARCFGCYHTASERARARARASRCCRSLPNPASVARAGSACDTYVYIRPVDGD